MDNFTWQHIKFEDGSNSYICMTEDNFNRMKEKYNLINIKDNFWLAKNKEQKINLFDCDEWDEEDDEEKINETIIGGCVSTPANVSMDDFADEFLEWIESKGYYFGGGFREYIEGEDDDNY